MLLWIQFYIQSLPASPVTSHLLELYLECMDNCGWARAMFEAHDRTEKLIFSRKLPWTAPVTAPPTPAWTKAGRRQEVDGGPGSPLPPPATAEEKTAAAKRPLPHTSRWRCCSHRCRSPSFCQCPCFPLPFESQSPLLDPLPRYQAKMYLEANRSSSRAAIVAKRDPTAPFHNWMGLPHLLPPPLADNIIANCSFYYSTACACIAIDCLTVYFCSTVLTHHRHPQHRHQYPRAHPTAIPTPAAPPSTPRPSWRLI